MLMLEKIQTPEFLARAARTRADAIELGGRRVSEMSRDELIEWVKRYNWLLVLLNFEDDRERERLYYTRNCP